MGEKQLSVNGDAFIINTRYGTYWVMIEYSRQDLSFTVKLYDTHPVMEIELPEWARWAGHLFDSEDNVIRLTCNPIFSKKYFLREYRDPMRAVQETIYRYEWPMHFESEIRKGNRSLQIDYEQLALEIKKKKDRKDQEDQSRTQDSRRRDLSEIKIYDYEDNI